MCVFTLTEVERLWGSWTVLVWIRTLLPLKLIGTFATSLPAKPDAWNSDRKQSEYARIKSHIKVKAKDLPLRSAAMTYLLGRGEPFGTDSCCRRCPSEPATSWLLIQKWFCFNSPMSVCHEDWTWNLDQKTDVSLSLESYLRDPAISTATWSAGHLQIRFQIRLHIWLRRDLDVMGEDRNNWLRK